MRLKTLLYLPFFGFLGLAAPAAAPGPWSASVGIGPAVVPGVWAPLRISAPAEAGAWVLEVRSISVSGKVSEPVVYSRNAGGEFEEPFFVTEAARVLKLRFLAAGLVQEELDLPLGGRLFPGHLVVTDGLGPPVQAALAGVLLPAEPVRVVSSPPVGWPGSPLSYGGLSALVVADPGPVLSPAQKTALRAWIASGGRLVVVSPRPGTGSLLAQVGPVPGWGKVSGTVPTADPQVWKALLELRPHGRDRLLGTDFGPPARDLPGRGSPVVPAAAVLLALWAIGVTLVLVLRRRRGLGPALAGAALGTLAVAVLWAGGTLDWDRGLAVHGREVVLPGDLGRFRNLEVQAPSRRSGPFDWPGGSPWALVLWKDGKAVPGTVKTSGPGTLSLGTFLPPLERQARYRVRWDGTELRWSENTGTGWATREEAPSELVPDGPWLAQMTARLPVAWSVGLDDTSCWLRPEPEGGTP